MVQLSGVILVLATLANPLLTQVEEPGSFYWAGRLVDAATGKPLEGATVSLIDMALFDATHLRARWKPFATVLTDVKGRFRLDIPVPPEVVIEEERGAGTEVERGRFVSEALEPINFAWTDVVVDLLEEVMSAP